MSLTQPTNVTINLVKIIESTHSYLWIKDGIERGHLLMQYPSSYIYHRRTSVKRSGDQMKESHRTKARVTTKPSISRCGIVRVVIRAQGRAAWSELQPPEELNARTSQRKRALMGCSLDPLFFLFLVGRERLVLYM